MADETPLRRRSSRLSVSTASSRRQSLVRSPARSRRGGALTSANSRGVEGPASLSDERALIASALAAETSGASEAAPGGRVKKVEAWYPVGDVPKTVLLFCLYFLQGIPMGMADLIPRMLTEHGASLSVIGTVQQCMWPFALKILWAPLVDSYYWPSVGKRKSWIIPAQLIIGALLIAGSSWVVPWLGTCTPGSAEAAAHSAGAAPAAAAAPCTPIATYSILGYFASLYFLAATQDIAVDAWAVTLLKPENARFASTTNVIGQVAATFTISQAYLMLSSASAERAPSSSAAPASAASAAASAAATGALDLPLLMTVCGVLFLVFTVFFAVFIPEAASSPSITTAAKPHGEATSSSAATSPELREPESLAETFSLFRQLLRVRPLQLLVLYMLTSRFVTSVPDSVSKPLLVKRGLDRKTEALVQWLVGPVGIVAPLVIPSLLAGRSMLHVHLMLVPIRAVIAQLWIPLVHAYSPDASALVVSLATSLSVIQLFLALASMTAMMSFFTTVVDPRIAATYVTLLATASNAGYHFAAKIAMLCVDALTPADVCAAVAADGSRVCESSLRGFVIAGAVFFVLGAAWLSTLVPRLKGLVGLPLSDWHVPNHGRP